MGAGDQGGQGGIPGQHAEAAVRADVVVGKAGPSTIAEAACRAAPWCSPRRCLDEDGNAEFVVGAGAGPYAPC